MSLASLLLADRSPTLRMLVLRELLNRPDSDPEIEELEGIREVDPLVSDLVELQEQNGSWIQGSVAGGGGRMQATSLALQRLGYFGFRSDFPAVKRGAEYIYSLQRKDGAWQLQTRSEEPEEREGYSMIPLQTALPLLGLVSCGYAIDARTERAFDWLLEQRLPDGAWPTGIASGNYGFVAGYRRLAHSRWGCRSNTTGALCCLAHHPKYRTSPEARRALDLLLGRETKEQHTLGFEVARKIGAEPARGFLTYFARFDTALVLDLCWRVGAGTDDERINEFVEFVRGLQGPYGLWEYAARPQASRWVTFDLLRSLSRLHQTTDWISLEPRTPFQTYPKKPKRY